MRVAVIGSFRRHYPEVQAAIRLFGEAGWEVTSPAGTSVLDPDKEFVRFESDLAYLSDAEVQAVTLERIFHADVVHVVTPSGYIGRTTCYEVGRLMQANRAIYFSEYPKDLPVEVPATHVRSAADLCAQILVPGDATPMSWPANSVIAKSEMAIV